MLAGIGLKAGWCIGLVLASIDLYMCLTLVLPLGILFYYIELASIELSVH